jgi:hypothetical protein
VRATGKALVLLGLIAREIFGVGVILVGVTTGMKEHFGEGEEASTVDTCVAKKGRLVVVSRDAHMVERL